MNFPHIHFSPQKGWNGDPNGLVYHNGVYHLFFQYEPKKNKWTLVFDGAKHHQK